MVELAPGVSLRDRVCVVTGASSGIGLETARELAALGATVVLICRDRTRGDAARTSIVESTGNQSIELLLADMASQRQVREAAAQFRATHDRLDILVNNAGAVFPRRELTEDGIERTFAVNHLGYFLRGERAGADREPSFQIDTQRPGSVEPAAPRGSETLTAQVGGTCPDG